MNAEAGIRNDICPLRDALRWSSTMDEQQCAEVEMLKTNLCFKDSEIFALRAELEHRNQEHQNLLITIERLEKTVAANIDRLLRRVDRLTNPVESESRKRRRR